MKNLYYALFPFKYLLDVGPLALVTGPYHGLSHLVFDVGSLPDFRIFFDFFATKRNVRYFLAETTAFLSALRVQAGEHLSVNIMKLLHIRHNKLDRFSIGLKDGREPVQT
jgi:hypothetical protein